MSRAVMLSAKLWASAGFSVVRAHDDGTKRPFGEWKAYMNAPASGSEVEAWFSREDVACYGLVCGANGLEMFEFEGRAVAEGWLAAFEQLMKDNGLGALWDTLTVGPESYTEETPSGGLHVLYRTTPVGPAKLANRPTTAEERQLAFVLGKTITKQLIMIESKGLGGFTMMAPAHSAHPTDKTLAESRWTLDANGRGHWRRTRGVPGVVPTISAADRDAMFAIAAMLDRMPTRDDKIEALGRAERLPWEQSDGSSPRDDFEARTDWAEILEPHGWVEVKGPGQGRYWRRPGKDAAGNGGVKGFGWSASTGRDAERDRMYVWSTSTELDHEIPMTKSYVWGKVNGIPESEVAGRLRGLGFGSSAWADNLSVETRPVIVHSIDESPQIDEAISRHQDEEIFDWCPGIGAGTNVFVDTVVPRADAATWIPDSVSGDDGGEVVGPPGVYLPDSFWDARPVFGVLRQAAHRALASPEGVLVAAIGLTLARVMPNVVVPACVGTEASMNLMVVTCGKSGDGKSVCRKIAKQTLIFAGAEELHEFPPSSGQGISAQYQQLRKPKGGEPYMEAIRWNALALVEESDKIAALAAQASNTLSSELRAAAMGEIIGSGNVGDTKTCMPEGTYRFVLAMCMQPELSAWLLDEKAGGLPQRFLFACVNDARVVKADDPGKWTVRLPFEATPDPVSGVPRAHTVMGISDAVCAEIYAETVARKRASVRGEGTDAYDGHGTLMRLKVAGALALLDGRLAISDEDWRLAGELAAASKATIRWMQSIQADASTKKAEASRKVKAADAKAIVAAERETIESRVQRAAADAILRKLARQGAEGETKADLRRGLTPPQRDVLGTVLDGLLAVGKVRFEDIERNGKQVGSRWFLVSS